MRKVKQINFEISRLIYSSVLNNTLSTIFVTAAISFTLARHYEKIIPTITNKYIILLILSLLFFYYVFSHEKVIKKVKLVDKNLGKDWLNNERRPYIPTAAFIDDNALQLQFMDIPYTYKLNMDLPDKYALEFKAKVINDVFAWCVNTSINESIAEGYMFQYIPCKRVLRPHFIIGYDKSKTSLRWLRPKDQTEKIKPEAPLKSINNLSLKAKDGWYFIRTEVKKSEKTVKSIWDDSIEKHVQKLKDNEGGDIPLDKARVNNVVEIKIYDMNDLGKEIYHNYFNEPPLKCFMGGTIGFRNCNYESALYKDIVLKQI
ncbi:MAG: hypothetical protein FJ241_08425 [Nitrospira sp.]|nr:hypothetical protein [Nitrospira sp.]